MTDAVIIQHPAPASASPKGSAARRELLTLIEEARSLGYVRGVLIAEGAQGDFEVLFSPTVTSSTALGLLQRGLAKHTKRVQIEDSDDDSECGDEG